MARWSWFGVLALGMAGCDDTLGQLNLFTLEDDVALGKKLDREIRENPDEYGPLLDPAEYPESYATLEGIRDEILATGEVEHADAFAWEVHLLHDDEVLNAFAAPGGYLYVYTGLVKYLEVEDHFAGVLGHEIAHAANRHSTEQLTKAYGVATLVELVLGEDPGAIAEIAEGLVSLSFSREDEAEADLTSVVYLCETDWAADGAAGFFEQIVEEGSVEIPEFASTHPSSESRVEDIHAAARERGCSTDLAEDTAWREFVRSLP